MRSTEFFSSLSILSIFTLFTYTLSISATNASNLTDYTLYFESHDYLFPFKPHADIIIDLPSHSLNFSNDIDFDEIYIIPTKPQQHASRRSLLWNKWDHTTSKHLVSGRFVGDPSRLRTFDDARALCREYYGDIASIQSQQEDKEARQLCKKMGGTSCWIGLTANFYEWEDGQYVSWSDWDKDEPEHSINEKCIQIQTENGKWSDSPCNKELYTICEKAVASYQGNYVVVSRQTTKEKAAEYCRNKFGSTLASVITKTDALQAHEACKMITKAPHGCWIGLSAPFTHFDNGLHVESIEGATWKNDQIADETKTKCVEIDKNGFWRGIPCDYERHILCNVHGVDTKQSEQDEEYLKKKEEEEKQQKIKDSERMKEEAEKKKHEQDEEELAEEKGKKETEKDKEETVNAESPIEKQIDALKKILKKQQERLAKEKARFEGKAVDTKVHKLNDLEIIEAKEERKEESGKKNKEDSTKGIREEIARLQKLDKEDSGTGAMDESLVENKEHETKEDRQHINTGIKKQEDRMGTARRQNRMKERMQLAQQHGYIHPNMHPNIINGYHPFGGAFGGSLHGATGNPYNYGGYPSFGYHNHMNQVPNQAPLPPNEAPPPPPMSYGQYQLMMKQMYGNRMNPMNLPRIPGMKGQYAPNRRLMEVDDAYKAVIKCVYEVGYKICIENDYEDGSVWVDTIIYDGKRMKDGKKKKDDAGYKKVELWTLYEGNDREVSDLHDYVQYFMVYEFEFVLEDDNMQSPQKECEVYNDEDDRVCIEKYKDRINVHFNENILNYKDDKQWDEIYTQQNKKCVHLRMDVLCVIEDDINDYKLEMNVATYKLSKSIH